MLSLHLEIVKPPWTSVRETCTQLRTQKSGNPGHPVSLRVIEGASEQTPQVTVDGVFSPFVTLSGTSGQRREMVVGTGFEPAERLLQACVAVAASVSAETAATQLRTQKLAESNCETMSSFERLREVIEAWPRLSPELRAAVLAVTRAVTK